VIPGEVMVTYLEIDQTQGVMGSGVLGIFLKQQLEQRSGSLGVTIPKREVGLLIEKIFGTFRIVFKILVPVQQGIRIP
jgi:hypothetical protein